jgi:feruloyl-CoA synthase
MSITFAGPDEADIIRQERSDGSVWLRSTKPLPPFSSRLTERLEYWAQLTPNQPFLAARHTDGWQTVTYGDALKAARSIAQALLNRGLENANPVLVLSGNGIEHALLSLACMQVGVIYCPTSVAYSTASQDFSRLHDIVDLVGPSLVFAADADVHGRALRTCIPPSIEVVVVKGDAGRPATAFRDLLATTAGAAVDVAASGIAANTVAKLLFTSGSTGFPKGVITTNGMITSCVRMLMASHELPTHEPPVLVDWLPWSHVLGGTCSFGLALFQGGTLFLDDGLPLPSQIERTVRNLREIAPTFYSSVPRGYEALVPWLQNDRALRERFFSRVQTLQYSGAAIAQHVCDAIDALALATIGKPVPWVSVYGSTEGGFMAIYRHSKGGSVGRVGLPAPGVVLKLTPLDGRTEARVRSTCVTPGYWKRDDLTADAFDEEGFFRTGDALDWVDRTRPASGLRYDGRTAEDFKLATGTWVRVGQLRAHLMSHLAPEVRDLVIVGENREYIAALGIPSNEAVAQDREARERVAAKLKALARDAAGSAQRVQRFAFLMSKLSIDAGEITDKGVLNQRTIVRRHADLIDMLYSDHPSADIVVETAGSARKRSSAKT